MAKQFAWSFYKSKEWHAVREYVMQRDSYLCRRCFAPAEEVHHITHLTEENINDVSISLNPENLMALCRDCHQREHSHDRASGNLKQKVLGDVWFDENGQPKM